MVGRTMVRPRKLLLTMQEPITLANIRRRIRDETTSLFDDASNRVIVALMAQSIRRWQDISQRTFEELTTLVRHHVEAEIFTISKDLMSADFFMMPGIPSFLLD